MKSPVSRRQALRNLLFGGAGVGVLSQSAMAQEASGTGSPAAATQAQGSCVLFPQAVEGPYYFDPHLVRADITQGKEGHPVRLILKAIEHGSCKPLAGARVDVWHCDAGGIYSGYASQGDDRSTSAKGETYLRGTQMTDADGKVEFKTIFPGWYPGRTPHIHVKVFLDEKTLVTSQIYFPDDLSKRIYQAEPPYNTRPVADTTNARDFIFQRGEKEGGGIVLAVEEGEGAPMQASLVMAVDRNNPQTGGSSIWNWFGQ